MFLLINYIVNKYTHIKIIQQIREYILETPGIFHWPQ